MLARCRPTRRLTIVLAAAFAACGDGGGGRPQDDGSIVRLDGASSLDGGAVDGSIADGALEDGGTAQADQALGSDGASSSDARATADAAPPPPPPPPDGGISDSAVGGTSCADIYQCLVGCSPNDLACANACIVAGSTVAQQRFSAANNCMVSASSGACAASCSSPSAQCDTCLQNACSSELAACFGGAPPPPPPTDGGLPGDGRSDGGGPLGCQGIFNCFGGCTNGSTTCLNACVAQGSAAGQAQFAALSSCLQSASSGTCASSCATPGPTCDNCLMGACTSEVNACQP